MTGASSASRPAGGDGEPLDLPPLHFPNVFALCADGTPVLLESFNPRLVAVGAFGLEVLAELPGTVPDGVAVDAEGGFTVGCYYPYHVYRIPPGGGTPQLILDDATGTQFPMPTNICAFGGELAMLAVASIGGHTLSAVDIGLADCR